MPKAEAKIDDTVIASSENTVLVEGNHYFPIEEVNMELLAAHEGLETVCHWKGTANYYDAVIDGKKYDGVAFEYKDPSEAAKDIKGKIAFWRDVQVHDGH